MSPSLEKPPSNSPAESAQKSPATEVEHHTSTLPAANLDDIRAEHGDLNHRAEEIHRLATEGEGSKIFEVMKDLPPHEITKLDAHYSKTYGRTISTEILDPKLNEALRALQRGRADLAAVLIGESRLEGARESNEHWAQGSEKNAAQDQKTLGELSTFTRWFSDIDDTLQLSKEASLTRAAELREKNREIEQVLTTSHQLREIAQSMEPALAELEASGRTAEATKVRESIRASLAQAQKLHELSTLPDFERSAALDKKVTAELNETIENLNTAITVCETTRTGCVVVGATVATGGLALGGAGVLVAVGGGTLAGTAIGATSNVARGITEVALDNKSAKEAARDALAQTGSDLKSAAISSVAAASGIGVARVLAPGEAAVVGLGTKLGIGAAAGATTGATSFTLKTGDRFVQATHEFVELHRNSSLSDGAYTEAYQRFLVERGFTPSELATAGIKEVAIATVGGGVGGSANALLGTSASVGRTIVVRSAESGANMAIGIGASAAEGDLSTATILSNITTSVIGDVAGNLSGRISTSPRAANPKPTPAPPQPEPTPAYKQEEGRTVLAGLSRKDDGYVFGRDGRPDRYLGRPVIGHNTPIDGGVYIGVSRREAIVVDFKKGPLLEQNYQEFLGRMNEVSGGSPQKFSEQLLPELERFCSDKFGGKSPVVGYRLEKILDEFQGGKDTKVLLDQFIHDGAGVCRHRALMAGAFLERMIKEGQIPGSVEVRRNTLGSSAHAWTEYIDPEGNRTIIDPMKGFVGHPDDPMAPWAYSRSGGPSRPQQRNVELAETQFFDRNRFDPDSNLGQTIKLLERMNAPARVHSTPEGHGFVDWGNINGLDGRPELIARAKHQIAAALETMNRHHGRIPVDSGIRFNTESREGITFIRLNNGQGNTRVILAVDPGGTPHVVGCYRHGDGRGNDYDMVDSIMSTALKQPGFRAAFGLEAPVRAGRRE